jgi:hypothetical protein
MPFEDASQRNSRGLLRGPFHRIFRHLSIAVGANSYAHAGSAEADTTTVVITAALDITLTRSVSI